MPTLTDFLTDSRPHVFDGAMGTMLYAHGVFINRCYDELNLKDPDLIRTKVNLIPEWVEEIRVIDIVGLDRQADGGTHVASTLEVGRVEVVKTESKGKANKRMRIKLSS